MLQRIFFISMAVFFLAGCHNITNIDKSLVVSENDRYLTYPDGTPFLWIGDTAWELFHKLDREEASEYMENRAEKGFSVIQAVVLAEMDGLRTPNAYGDVPFTDLDPAQPNESYFEHVDFIVNKAESLGLFVGMLPTWGDKLYSNHPGSGPVVFNKENARIYGEFLGRRYRDKPIIWILGGDRNVANLDVLEIWRAMASGLQAGDGGKHLITYHPRGATSSSWYLHNEEWLDFNMYQSGHTQHYSDVYRFAEHDALLFPRKPFLEGEPPYEDIGVSFWTNWNIPRAESADDTLRPIDHTGILRDPSVYKDGLFTDSDVRVHGYWNFLAGACGYTYGNNAIWQMWEPGTPYAIPCIMSWREAMDRPGAGDLRHMRKLFEARPFHKLIPDQSIIYGPVPGGREHVRAAIAGDRSFLMVYLSVGQHVWVQTSKLNHPVDAWWYDTREGKAIKALELEAGGIMEFTPPTSGTGQDWMLVLDDAAAGLPPL